MRTANIFFTVTMPLDWRDMLHEIGRQQDCSVAELIRRAIRKTYFEQGKAETDPK